jgi:hypothetical protein
MTGNSDSECNGNSNGCHDIDGDCNGASSCKWTLIVVEVDVPLITLTRSLIDFDAEQLNFRGCF